MTTRGRYVSGLVAVAAAAFLASWVAQPEVRNGMWVASGIALAVQGPFGWWVLRAVGTERLLLVWALGIGTRLAVVAACGATIAPRLGLPLAPTLLTLVGALMAGVAVEVIVLRTEVG